MPEPSLADVAAMDLEDKLYIAITRAPDFADEAVAAELRNLLSPAAIVTMVVSLVIIAGVIATGVGGAVLIAVGWAMVGWAIFDAVGHFIDFFNLLRNAKTEPELNQAAKMFAKAVAAIGVGALVALLTKGAGKAASKSGKKADDLVEELSEKIAKKADDVPANRRSAGPIVPRSEFPPGKITGEYDMMNPGPLDPRDAGSFSGGRYKEIELDQDVVLYRSGVSERPLGQYFAKDPPVSEIQSRIDSAVLPKWPGGGTSPMDSVFEIKIPKGTKVYVGEVSSQGGFYVGGTEQIFVKQPWNVPGVQVMGSTPF